jgi:glycosyltransferase involved in cell wall biosynthesis
MDKSKKFVKQLGFIPPPYGGVSVYVKRLTERLNKDGYVSGAYYFAGKVDESVEKSPLYDSFQWLSTKRFVQRLLRLIKETKDYKIIHSHFGLESMIFLWTLVFFLRKKLVVTVHNSWSENFYSSTNSMNRFFLKQLAKTDTKWIAVSEEARAQMQKLPVKFKNISVIPAFIYSQSEYDEKEILSESLLSFIKGKNRVIVFYGHAFVLNNGDDVYGYHSTIEMFYELIKRDTKDVSLVMCVGEKNQDEINKLKEFACNNVYS